jgi:uracil DNA glycosylase
MNKSLTVSPSDPEYHIDLWSKFSEKIIKKLSEKDFIVWILLGEKSSDCKNFITNKNHVILESTHPSQKSFIGSNIFKNVNKELYKRGIDKIVW